MIKQKLPDGWKEVTLRDIAEFINGRAFKPSEWETEGKIIIRIQDLTGNIDNPNFTTKTFEEKYLVKSGDLLISWSATLNAFIWNKEKGWLNQHIFKVAEKKDAIDKKYLFYLIKTKINEMKKNTHGSTMKHITKGDFETIKILLPPIATQKKIVSILGGAGKAKEWRKDADALTNDFLKSVFLEMFGKYLKDKKNYKKIIHFCPSEKSAIKAGPFGSSLKKEFYVEKGYKIYGQEQVIKNDFTYGDYYIGEERYKKLENCKIQSGDILISLVGSYGYISIVPEKFEPGIINPRLMKITFDKIKMNPVFFRNLFLSDFIKDQLKRTSHGGTMDIINVGIVKKVNFPDVPIELQDKFALIVKEVEAMKEQQKHSKNQIDNLFNALMQKAFKGGLKC